MVSSPLADVVAGYGSVLVAFSGGVDSALVAVTARRVLGRDRGVAALGVSPSLAEAQRRQAWDVARAFDVALLEVATHELAEPGYVANAPSRCYFCKRELWSRLSAIAQTRGLALVADGTNRDDLGDHRPGQRAGTERDVRSPLVEAGFTKGDVRNEARRLGIPIWNAPAAPCLASRIRYGLEVTPERLRQIEEAEAFLRAIGVEGDLRVRHHGHEARIEVTPAGLPVIRAGRDRIVARFRILGFDRITLDRGGYRRGSLLDRRDSTPEVLGARA